MSISEILNKFENLDYKGFDEHDVGSSLRVLINENTTNIDNALKAEIMAFDFAENYRDEATSWGMYFGPMMVWNNDDGTSTESPSIKFVTLEMIDYWEQRANGSLNPILRARYAGLVWEFKKRITSINPTHEICRIYIKALIDIANGSFHKYEVNTFSKLERALDLSIGLNDNTLIFETKEALLAYEDKYAIDDKPGLWGYSFDLLVGNRKVNLTQSEELRILEELENKLNRLTSKDPKENKIDPWVAEAAANRLANYYRKKQKNEDFERVVLKIGETFEKAIENASAMQASGLLDHLYRLYTNFSFKNKAEEVLLKIRELGPKVASELKPISHSFELPKEKIDDYVMAMTRGEPEEIIVRITGHFIPIREKAKEQIFDLSKSAPLTFLITQQIQDEKGRVIATIGSLEDDLEGHIVKRISDNLSFSGWFLREVLKEAIDNKGLNKALILSYVGKTPVINKERLEIINRALDAYFQNDFLVFAHLIIPQIEEAIRMIIEITGGNVLKTSKSGGYHLRTFDEILRDDIIKEALGEDFGDYFRILFTDQRGWNLRNSICHGMANPNMFNYLSADRILHAFLCLGLIIEVT